MSLSQKPKSHKHAYITNAEIKPGLQPVAVSQTGLHFPCTAVIHADTLWMLYEDILTAFMVIKCS